VHSGVSARLVAAAGFKPVVGSVKQIPGGFDSHPLPLFLHRIVTSPNRNKRLDRCGIGALRELFSRTVVYQVRAMS
jgi:hypothetical protein